MIFSLNSIASQFDEKQFVKKFVKKQKKLLTIGKNVCVIWEKCEGEEESLRINDTGYYIM